MKHAEETEQIFLKITDETPDEIKMKVDWSLDISTAIDEALHKKRMTQKGIGGKVRHFHRVRSFMARRHS